MNRYALMLLLLFLTGCAPTIYNHPSKGEQEFYADQSHCEALAMQTTTIYGDVMQLPNKRRFEGCMRGKGWRPVQQ